MRALPVCAGRIGTCLTSATSMATSCVPSAWLTVTDRRTAHQQLSGPNGSAWTAVLQRLFSGAYLVPAGSPVRCSWATYRPWWWRLRLPLAGHLPDGRIEPVPNVDQRDLDDQGCKSLLVVVVGGGV